MSPFFYEYIVYKHIIYNMNKFEKWLNAINEELASEPAIAAEPTVSSSTSSNREAMMSDVDNIMTSLETLAGELQESLNEAEDVEEAANIDATKAMATGALAATAAAGVGAYKGTQALIDWTVRAPKARKAQDTVNQMKIKIVGLQNAFRQAKNDSKKKQIIKERIEKAREQADQLQDQVDSKFENASGIVLKALANEKLKGKIEIAKVELGDSTPERQAEIKDQLKKYNDQYQANSQALKELEPNKEEIKAAEERKKKAEQRAKEKETQAALQSAKEGDKETSPEDGAKAAAEKAAQQKEAQLEDAISQYDSNIQTEMDRVSKLNNDLSDAEKEKEASTKPDEVEKKINLIKAEISKSKEDINQMKAAKEKLKKQLSPKESLVIRAMAASLNELAVEISEKAEWQLEGTVLYTKYDSMLRKVEATNYLTESRSMTIKDKFSKLL